MAYGYRNEVSQYVKEIKTITREFHERVTLDYDNQNSTYPSYFSERQSIENTTWVSHEEKNYITERNSGQITEINDNYVHHESHYQHEKFTFEDSVDSHEYESDDYIYLENGTSSDFHCEVSTYESIVDDSEYHSNDQLDPEMNAGHSGHSEYYTSSHDDYEYSENSEHLEDYISSHDVYEYSENLEDYYLEDNYGYSEYSDDYYDDDY